MHFWDEHKTITRYYEMKVSGVCEKYQLRQLEYDILMFIYKTRVMQRLYARTRTMLKALRCSISRIVRKRISSF